MIKIYLLISIRRQLFHARSKPEAKTQWKFVIRKFVDSGVRTVHAEGVARGAINSEDMVSSDEDSDALEEWIQEIKKRGSIALTSFSNGYKSQFSNGNIKSQIPVKKVTFKPVKVEHITSEEEPINVSENKGHLHEEGWQDPICKLFQTDNAEVCNGGGTYEGESSRPKNCGRVRDEPQARVKLETGGYEERGAVSGKAISKDVDRPASQSRTRNREARFLDMGFSAELIQRAFSLMHGTEADDSTVLQFLLDFRDENHGQQKLREISEGRNPNLQEKRINSNRESGSAHVNERPHTKKLFDKMVFDPSWDNEDLDPLTSESEEEDGGIVFRRHSNPSNWATREKAETVNGGSHSERDIPAEIDCRHVLRSHGFSADLIERAIRELGEGADPDMLLEYILSPRIQQDPEASTSDLAGSKDVNTVEKLVTECGFPARAVERAILICNTPMWNADQDQIVDLVDFLAAHGGQLNESDNDDASSDEGAQEEEEETCWTLLREKISEDVTANRGKRKLGYPEADARKTIVRRGRPPNVKREPIDCARAKREPITYSPISQRETPVRSPRVKSEPTPRGNTFVGRRGQVPARVGRPRMKEEVVEKVDKHKGAVGFGLPGRPVQPRYLSADVRGAPFFYFENVASMPNDEWERIRRHLFDVEPEFVDSLHFSACRRPRGYIHNLPIEGRRKLLDDPPMTIQELLPHTKAFWPEWDPRTKLNCITTRMGSEFLAKKLQIKEGTALQSANPSAEQQREILHLCRHWNLVWTAPNIPTPISENEIEAMLGFAPDHSRNCLSARARYKALGNSFSVYTVAFHFSVLKPLYPRGIKVLSLFSGIGGAEVALDKIGIKLLVVVSVEIDEGIRRCLEAWWGATRQTGILNQKIHNVAELGRAEISDLVNQYGGFDLIVGGSPCNNLSGSNHVTRVGLDGKQSTVFFEFSRIVTTVRELTIRLHHEKR